MANEAHASNVFKIEKCRAKIYGVVDLIECFSSEQAPICGCSLSFGQIYFCKHSRRNEFIENTEKLRSELSFLSDVSKSDKQE